MSAQVRPLGRLVAALPAARVSATAAAYDEFAIGASAPTGREESAWFPG